MHILQIAFRHSIADHRFPDKAMADAAYAALTAAMAEYREFSNDRSAIVRFAMPTGESTVRVADLVAVNAFADSDGDDLQRALEDHCVANRLADARVRARVKAAMPDADLPPVV